MKFKAFLIAFLFAPMMLLGINPASAATIATTGCAVGASSHIHGTVSTTTNTLRGYTRVYGSQTARYVQPVIGPDIVWTASMIKLTVVGPNGSYIKSYYTSSSRPYANFDVVKGGSVRATFYWQGRKTAGGVTTYRGTASCTTRYIKK